MARAADLSRVDRLWRCTRCGYFAFSMPVESVYKEGKEFAAILHECPLCGDTDWHWCGGDDRATRSGYLSALRSANG